MRLDLVELHFVERRDQRPVATAHLMLPGPVGGRSHVEAVAGSVEDVPAVPGHTIPPAGTRPATSVVPRASPVPTQPFAGKHRIYEVDRAIVAQPHLQGGRREARESEIRELRIPVPEIAF